MRSRARGQSGTAPQQEGDVLPDPGGDGLQAAGLELEAVEGGRHPEEGGGVGAPSAQTRTDRNPLEQADAKG